MGFSRQEYWSGLPCPSPGDLPSPGIKSTLLVCPTLAGEFFTTSATWESPVRGRRPRSDKEHFVMWGYWQAKELLRKALVRCASSAGTLERVSCSWLHLFKKFFDYWSVIGLQCCVSAIQPSESAPSIHNPSSLEAPSPTPTSIPSL